MALAPNRPGSRPPRGGKPPLSAEELRTRIASFPRWHYEFDLQGVKTPIFNPAHANRHRERVRYFFDPLVEVFDGSLKGKRVLDLGCNAGFWSLKAIEAGCDFVLGIDGRQMHIDQANLVFEANMVDEARYRFRTGNVFTDDFSGEGSFDIVLCLGLLYHVSKPVELIERIAAVNTDVLLIDTEVSGSGGASYRLRRESIDEPRNAVDFETVFIPSRRAVINLASAFGYTVVPLRLRASSYRGMRGYLRGKRVAFMCAKHTDLSALPRAFADEPLAGLEYATRNMFRLARAGLSTATLLGRSSYARWRARNSSS
jgi:tRNA (mo5U34)-methyltransferase